MAKKINAAVVKEFFFNHGEKVALGTCAFLALLFGTLGLLRAMSAGKPEGSNVRWEDAFQKEQKRLASALASASAPPLPKDIEDKMKAEYYVWDPVTSTYIPTPYNFLAEANTTKRISPRVLPIKATGPKQIQVDYIRALAYVHDIESLGVWGLGYADATSPMPMPMPMPVVKGKKGEPQPVEPLPAMQKLGRPVRMAVVTAVFPMKAQVEEFQRTLRLTSQKELFDLPREDLPRPLGLNVIKYEIVNGQKVNEQILIFYNAKTKALAKAEKSQDKNGKEVWTVEGVEYKTRPSMVVLDDLMRTAIYDEDTPEMMKDYIWHGLHTPLPKLGNAHYPKFNFEGFDIAFLDDPLPKTDVVKKGSGSPMGDVKVPSRTKDSMKDKRPMPPPMGSGDDPNKMVGTLPTPRLIKDKELRASNVPLADRLSLNDVKKSKYNLFHVLGLEMPPQEKEKGGAANPMGSGGRPKPMPNDGRGPGPNLGADRFFDAWDIDPPGAGISGGSGTPMATPMPEPKKGSGPKDLGGAQQPPWPNWERDAVVRFIDPDVVPGKTYQYAVQVRMYNPNFGKKVDEIAFGDLARHEELPPSTWELTPKIAIPEEYYLYAVDQQLVDGTGDPKKLPKGETAEYVKEHTFFQIHQWTETAPDQAHNRDELVIGDWVVGVRIPVRRGESIGTQAPVRTPVWMKKKDVFELPTMKVGDPKKNITTPGFLIDFKREGERPILVDFTGGKRLKATAIEEESAVEALILSADGKLSVLNSRRDSDAVQPDFPTPVTRQERVTTSRRHAEEIINGTPATTIPKGKMPMPMP